MRAFLVMFVALGGMHLTYAQGVKGGLLLGFNSCQIDGDYLGGFDKLGGRVGVFGQTAISKKINFRLEMLYSGRGSRQTYKENEPPSGMWDMVSLHYVEMPFVFTCDLSAWLKIKNRHFYAIGAPVYSRLFFSKIISLSGGSFGSQPFKLNEFGAQGGVGYTLGKKLNADLRFHYSVVSISVGNNTLWFQRNRGLRNNLLSLQLNWVL